MSLALNWAQIFLGTCLVRESLTSRIVARVGGRGYDLLDCTLQDDGT